MQLLSPLICKRRNVSLYQAVHFPTYLRVSFLAFSLSDMIDVKKCFVHVWQFSLVRHIFQCVHTPQKSVAISENDGVTKKQTNKLITRIWYQQHIVLFLLLSDVTEGC